VTGLLVTLRSGPPPIPFARLGNRSSDRLAVKAAPSRYSVSGRRSLYVVTWAYVSAWMSWCWMLLKGLFPLCSFSGGAIDWTWFAEIRSLLGNVRLQVQRPERQFRIDALFDVAA
jgi:hypothetical protein